MNLNDAQKLAIELMSDHGLIDRGWYFQWDNSKNRFGVCKFKQVNRLTRECAYGIIGLSRNLVALNDQDQVMDTILHEIAHALVGPFHGHDDVWKAKCVEIGARPVRCYDDPVDGNPGVQRVKGNWQAACPSCSAEYDRHTQPKVGRIYWCNCSRRRGRSDSNRLMFKDVRMSHYGVAASKPKETTLNGT